MSNTGFNSDETQVYLSLAGDNVPVLVAAPPKNLLVVQLPDGDDE